MEATAARAERRFRRLLLAYPAAWREQHGEAALGVLLDAAEADGRSGPTAQAVADVVVSGVRERAATALDARTRTRIASIATGIGGGFAVAYFGVYIGPSWGGWVPAAHLGPVVILLSWVAVGLAIWRARSNRARIASVVIAGLLPALLWFTHGLLPTGGALIATGWSRPSNANAAFLACIAALALVGSVRRRTALTSAVISAVAFTAALFATGAWRDDYDQSLWGSPDRISFGFDGTLQRLISFGRLPLTHGGPEVQVIEWLQAGVLRLDTLTTGAVLVALVAALLLAIRGRRSAALTLAILTCPFVVGLSVCAAQPLGVWFQ